MAPINRSNNLVKITKELLNNDNLNATIEKLLPNNYDFEIHRTIAKIRVTNAKRIALQMPEGLLLFSCIIADILTKFAYENGDEIDVIVMGDVTYGACCIDDYTSRALQCDLLVHYGHSCLVSLDTTNTFYVFVYISIDTKHFLDTINTNFSEGCHLILVSTVQFISTLQAVRDELSKKFRVTIPKIAPLSFGEILGCTAPTIASSDTDCIIYLGDGRFHLEAVMMANPDTPAYRYDPYAKVITHEYYDHDTMRRNRNQSIAIAREARTFGIILGTLGRQGSSAVLESIKNAIEKSGRSHVTILLSEVFPAKLDLFGDAIDAFIQIACPRLSIDWGTFFKKPLLTPFEACVALGVAQWTPSERYPMDFYAHDSLGNWTPNHRPGGPDARRGRPQKKHIVIGETKAPTDLIQVQIEQVTGDACPEHEWVGCTNCTCSNIAE